MKIAHSVMYYWSSVSGSEEYMRSISEQLVKKSYDVTVLTSSDVQRGHEETLNGVRIRRYPTLLLPNTFYGLHLVFRNFHDSLSGMMSTLTYGFTPLIYFDIVKRGYNLVHATPIPANNVILSYFAAKKARIPFVCTPFFHYRTKEFYNELYINLLKKADAVLVCTQTEGKILNRLGIGKDRIHQIRMGVDAEAWKNVNPRNFRRKHGLDSSPVILFGARKTREKGAFFVLEAMREVWKRHPDVYLVAMGSRTRDWVECLNSLHKEERSRMIDLDLTKASDQQEKRDAFAACDLFVMPSVADAYGIVYLESWLCRKAVIAADTPVMREVVSNGVDGFLVKFGNTESLADNINKLVEHEELRRTMGAYGHKKVLKNNTWSIISDRIISLYQTIVR